MKKILLCRSATTYCIAMFGSCSKNQKAFPEPIFRYPRNAGSANGDGRTFVSTHPLVHKHVKISVDEWIMETTRPHKQVQNPLVQFFFASLLST